MKYLVIAAALLATTSAHAADTGAYDWSGAYIGVQAGGRWAEDKDGVTGWIVGTPKKYDGALIGGYAGYNFQFDNFVIGAEGSIIANKVSRVFRDWTYSHTTEAQQVISMNARLGYALDRSLLYATGGYSRAYYKFIAEDILSYPPYSASKHSFSGWNIGAGIDYAMTDNLIARAEYRYFDIKKENYADYYMKRKQQTAVLGLAYKF